VLRFSGGGLPVDDVEALAQLVPQNLSQHVPLLRTALYGQNSNRTAEKEKILDAAVEVMISLLGLVVKQTSALLILQFEIGTSLFPKTTQHDQGVFWKTVSKLGTVVQREKRLSLLILVREVDPTNSAVKFAKDKNSLIRLPGLADDMLVNYVSAYLGVADHLVPAPLRNFVSKVTLGNPLYVRETIDEMQTRGFVCMNRARNGKCQSIECQSMDAINVAAWQQTSMVGGTICQLEALEPLESAILKMSTCFSGPFSLPDLAASSCPQWAGSTHFDLLRLYKRLQILVEKRIIDLVDAPAAGETPRGKVHNPFGSTQYFQTRNLLIRAVGSSMVLEQQRKSAKRQALVDRALSRELPARMEVLARSKNAQHIPWYYEQAFRRMP
jgi:hypothetical protein